MSTKNNDLIEQTGDNLEEIPKVVLPEKEEILTREDELLAGLFAAIDENEDPTANTKTLFINRHGKPYFKFDIRPLDEKELLACRRKATKYHENPAGKKYPRIEGETDPALLRSLKIYTATTEEYKKKLWDNPAVLDKYNLINGYDAIDLVFVAGEKDAIVDQVDAISGFGETNLEQYAKN